MAQTCLVQQVLRGAKVGKALKSAIKSGHIACVCNAQCQLERLCVEDNEQRVPPGHLAVRLTEATTLKRILTTWTAPRQYHTSGWLQKPEKTRINGRKTEVSFEELSEMLRSGGIILVDVREPQELEEYGEIPGAVNIPLSELKLALQLPEEEFYRRYFSSKPLSPGSSLILYGRGPNQGITALEIAHKNGFKQSVHYKGGWEDWSTKTGQPLKKQAKV